MRMGYLILSTLVSTLAFLSIAVAQEVAVMDGAKVGDGPAMHAGTYRIEVVKNQNSSEVLFYLNNAQPEASVGL